VEGLTTAEAAARLYRDGPNTLPIPPAVPAWRQLVGQMTHFFALMFWVASLLGFLAGLPALGLAIIVVIIFNGLFAFVQEYRAERAAEQLRNLLPRRVTVFRDGVAHEIDATQLVVGDLVMLEAGARVSADLRVVEAHSLLIDTATLTGESVPVAVDIEQDVFSGTFVVEGEGTAIVEATGSGTRLAGIAELTHAGRRPPSPLTLELHRVVRIIAVVAMGVGVSFFVLALLLGLDLSEGFVFGIGVTVALVPCGLLPTVTLSLAIGAQRMVRSDALVRRLESVETLGSTTFICTDKTGTLTSNQMQVVEVWTPDARYRIHGAGYEPEGEIEVVHGSRTDALLAAALCGARCSTGRAVQVEGEWQAQGDPMEAALDVLARRLGIDKAADERARPVVRRFPFDPRRRRMSIVAGDSLLVKGAPDSVLPLCDDVDVAVKVLDDMTSHGLRVLAVAERALVGGLPTTAGVAESGLELRGLIGLEDPPRPAAAKALQACRASGIRVAVITGDHPETARAVAEEVGLLDQGGIVLTGAELPADEAVLGATLDREGVVVARVAPEDKLRIARALQARGHVVAMTGDGVNDGPALQEADIGIAMGRTGTDVAREASDLVLLDDDFATIVTAVEQGKSTFANIRHFLTYHLTDNVAELTPFVVWALSGGRIPLALTVLQVLALDIGTDTLPAVALGAEPPESRASPRPPERGHLLNRSVAIRAFGFLGPTEALFEMIAFFTVFAAAGWRPGESFPTGDTLLLASGAAFSAVVIGQMANAFACRSTTRWPGSLGWFTNRLLLWALAAEALLFAAFLGIPFLADQLRQSVPSVEGWAVAVMTAPAVLAVDALYKWQVRSRRTISSS
jgi:magnesium-transporting ATPase (P-type)